MGNAARGKIFLLKKVYCL